MEPWRPLLIAVAGLVAATLGRDAGAQRELVARAVSEARRLGNEDALVHLAEEIGAAGIDQCLGHASRAGRLICAQSARYLEHPWPVLAVLATVLRDHDRQVASRAAESMVIILSSLDPGDLGPEEPDPSATEELLQGLRGLAGDRDLSSDIVAQVVTAASALARAAGAGRDVARDALGHPEVAVRRAGVAALAGSDETEDVAALAALVERESDQLTRALAVAETCEATAARGREMPEAVVEQASVLLDDRRVRPSTVGPLLACLARASTPQVRPLREQAARHPNAGARAAWAALVSDGER
jgi:hypothetical protein